MLGSPCLYVTPFVGFKLPMSFLDIFSIASLITKILYFDVGTNIAHCIFFRKVQYLICWVMSEFVSFWHFVLQLINHFNYKIDTPLLILAFLQHQARTRSALFQISNRRQDSQKSVLQLESNDFPDFGVQTPYQALKRII